jgi:DNA transformation protein and related proteins
MAVSDSYLAYVLDQLTGLGRVRSRRMFGGVGLYADELFFGLISGDGLYLKVDDASRSRFVARGMGPFKPFPDKPDYVMGYYEVPADVIEEAEELLAWARTALRVAAAAPLKAQAVKAGRTGARMQKAGSTPKAESRKAGARRRRPGDAS